jgi:Flp pilus assembly pilin Flp
MRRLEMLHSFLHDDDGQDLIEYGLLAGLISIVAFSAMALTGTSVNDFFVFIHNKVAAVAAAS